MILQTPTGKGKKRLISEGSAEGFIHEGDGFILKMEAVRSSERSVNL
jgi:hypothetical protein